MRELPNHQLSPENEAILALKWEELLESLQNRKLNATQVLDAYMAQALEATGRCNSVTEFNPKAKVKQFGVKIVKL